MIFLSHNYNDKPIIEPIAETLASVFGRDFVFYDSWSIQPGEGIIDKMNKGLEECKFFFFFVSKNSLQSNMVKLEWQNALYRATHNQIKIIPVKLDDCLMPAILTQTLYIDIYGQGLETGKRQILDVINGNNTYNGVYQTYENLRGYIKKKDNILNIEFRAETFMEPNPKYLILLDNNSTDFTINTPDDNSYSSNFYNDFKFENMTASFLYITPDRPISTGFPFKVILRFNTDIKFRGLMKAVSNNSYRRIPVIEV